jgi:hypothetical protein
MELFISELSERRFKIRHFPPKPLRKVHGFAVTIFRANDLQGSNKIPKIDDPNNINSFVAIHMLPDPNAITTQHTNVQLRNANPTFGETFFL